MDSQAGNGPIAVPRRSMLLGAAGGLGLAFVGTGAGAASAAASKEKDSAGSTGSTFDWDTGNVADAIIVGQAEKPILIYLNDNDATIIVRITTLLQNAWFDAIAPYHPTATGIYSTLGRRPSSEAATNRNKNIAIMYATLRILSNSIPQGTATWRSLLSDVGLDPDDDSTDRTSPIGIGNLAGRGVIAARNHDGMNELGDVGRKYNFEPYRDYTGYQPKNTAYELRDPSHWQPPMTTCDKIGPFKIQQFINPQLQYTRPYTFTDVKKYLLPAPVNSDVHNSAGYKQQVDESLAFSAELNNEMKMASETFDMKFETLGASVGMAGVNLGFDEWFQFHMVTAVATFDALIAAWYNKNVWDGVRPFSAIAHVYGNGPVTAWGGPYKGTVTDMPANEWMPYLGYPDHPEYPSGSTTLFHAHSQSAARFFGTDRTSLTFSFPKGSSRIEPGLTPTEDTTLSFTSWKTFADTAGMSRAWGGVHFLSAVRAGAALGPQFGDMAYDFVMSHVNGNPIKH